MLNSGREAMEGIPVFRGAGEPVFSHGHDVLVSLSGMTGPDLYEELAEPIRNQSIPCQVEPLT